MPWPIFRIIGNAVKKIRYSTSNEIHKKPPWKVLFFGADEFSLFALKALSKEYREGSLVDRLEVVTTIKGKANPVKMYSEKESLCVHKWPINLDEGKFDVGLVVSFGHLIPESLIKKFYFGMLNIHASLLPRWRGAAPIIYALANGDKLTGITVMEISPHKFDVGRILSQASINIEPDMKMPELFEKLGNLGAENLIQILNNLPTALLNAKIQPAHGITYAPKIKPNFAQIKWNMMTSEQVYNLHRALTGIYNLSTTWKNTPIKLINLALSKEDGIFSYNMKFKPGFVEYDKQKQLLKILCSDFKFVTAEKVSVLNRKVMSATDFNNGYLKKELPNCRYFE